MIFPDPGRNTVARMRDDHAGPVYTTDNPAYPSRLRARFIVVDPADSKRIYVLFGGAGAAQAGPAWLCISNDRGATWSRLKDFSGERIRSVYFDSGLSVVTESGVFAMAENGWEQSAPPPGGIGFASGRR